MLDSIDTLIGFVLIVSIVSLLITVLVQAASACFNLRGKTLARSLALTLETAAPGTLEKAGKAAHALAKHILTMPHLTDSDLVNRKLATAIRPQEVFATLLELVKAPATAESTRDTARAVLAKFGVSDSVLAHAEQARSAVTSASKALRSLGSEPMSAIADQLDRQLAVTFHTVGNIATLAADTYKAAWERFHFWFESSQDRAQQWFAARTRVLTILLSFLAAFLLQLDAVEVFKRVSSDRELRDKLVASVGAFTERAEKTLGETETVLLVAHGRWAKAMDGKPALGEPEETRVAREAFAKLGEQTKQALRELKPRTDEPRGAYVARFGEVLGADEGKAAIGKALGMTIDSTAQEAVSGKSNEFIQFRSQLEATGFDLLVIEGRWAKELDEQNQPITRLTWSHHGPGMILMALLLTLGAPFWFNMLKSLSALRSLVARDISKEEEAAEAKSAKTGIDKVPAPPPV